MFDDTMSFDLLSRGRAAAKAGEKAEAVRNLNHCLSLEPANDVRLEALYWLSEASDDLKVKRDCLEEILAANLGDARARRKLALLDGRLKAEDIVDGDHIPAPAIGSSPEAAAQAFTCPKCGGRRVFAPDGQTLVCEYCETQEKVAHKQAHPDQGDDFLVALATAKAQRKPVTARSIHCSGCGSIFLLPPEIITLICPYCGTPYALEQVELRELDAPDSIIPFQMDANAARAAFASWLHQELPGSAAKIMSIQGIYIPAWVFTLGGQIDWSGRIYHYNDKRWSPVSGSRVVGEDNLVIPASKRLDPEFGEVYSQYDPSAAQPFDLRYLANWMAETFQIPAAEASIEARSAAVERMRRDIQANEVSQSVDQFLMRTTNLLVTMYRLMLLPLWLGAYRLEGKSYPLLVNGQSGQVLAHHPKRGISGWLDKLFE